LIATAAIERWPLREAFTIARGSKLEAVVVVARVERDGLVGIGEALPYARYGETPEAVAREIEGLRFGSREELRASCPTGAARNAVDLALWDLEAKASGRRVWELLGIAEPRPVTTAFTIPIRDVETTRAAARREASRPLLKVKLGGTHDLACVEAVREEAPSARLIVDANEGWDIATLERLAPRLAELGVELVEQPLPADDDAVLERFESPVPLCADESFHGEDALERVIDRYDAVNVKLDKQGGLTAALDVAARAERSGLRIMVGSMVATSLAVAPAVLLAQRAEWTDLDGPLFLVRDREHGLRFDASIVHPPERELWG
jgi:L-alanine-DL-glutamate epimerase-like enolase superfamily enzyme